MKARVEGNIDGLLSSKLFLFRQVYFALMVLDKIQIVKMYLKSLVWVSGKMLFLDKW